MGPNSVKPIDLIVEDQGGPQATEKLLGRIQDLVASAEKMEVLVNFDQHNPEHIKKRRSGLTRREDLILYGKKPQYFKYILPTVELSPSHFVKAKELLLGSTSYQAVHGLSSGVIDGPRYVIRVFNQDEVFLVTISKINLPTIWFSGESFDPFGGSLHKETEVKWHKLIEAAVDQSG